MLFRILSFHCIHISISFYLFKKKHLVKRTADIYRIVNTNLSYLKAHIPPTLVQDAYIRTKAYPKLRKLVQRYSSFPT